MRRVVNRDGNGFFDGNYELQCALSADDVGALREVQGDGAGTDVVRQLVALMWR